MGKSVSTEPERYAGIAKTIRERRSIKSHYRSDPVTKELIIELLSDAVWAPNHGLREPWRFIFVPTEEKQAFIDELLPAFPEGEKDKMQQYFGQVSAFLIVIMNEDPRQKQWEENFGAVSALIQNFQLLAWERELGVVWKTNPHIYNPKVRHILGIEPGEKIAGFLHLGYFDLGQVPTARPRTPVEQRLVIYEKNKLV